MVVTFVHHSKTGHLTSGAGHLRAAGYTQFTIQLVPGQEAALADWARIRQAFV
jgi:hypothetical protein